MVTVLLISLEAGFTLGADLCVPLKQNVPSKRFHQTDVQIHLISPQSLPESVRHLRGIVRGYVDGNDWFYDVVQVFHAVSGGGWARPRLARPLLRS